MRQADGDARDVFLTGLRPAETGKDRLRPEDVCESVCMWRGHISSYSVDLRGIASFHRGVSAAIYPKSSLETMIASLIIHLPDPTLGTGRSPLRQELRPRHGTDR